MGISLFNNVQQQIRNFSLAFLVKFLFMHHLGFFVVKFLFFQSISSCLLELIFGCILLLIWSGLCSNVQDAFHFLPSRLVVFPLISFQVIRVLVDGSCRFILFALVEGFTPLCFVVSSSLNISTNLKLKAMFGQEGV